MKNKKGFAMVQLILIAIALLAFAIITIFAYKAFEDLNTDLQADLDLSTEAKAVSSDLHTRMPSTMDNAFLIVFGLLYIVSLVAAYFVDDNPLWLIVIVFLLIVTMIVGGILSNVWDDFTDESSITFENDFPKMNWILDNFLLVLLVMGATIGLTIFAKGRG